MSKETYLSGNNFDFTAVLEWSGLYAHAGLYDNEKGAGWVNLPSCELLVLTGLCRGISSPSRWALWENPSHAAAPPISGGYGSHLQASRTLLAVFGLLGINPLGTTSQSKITGNPNQLAQLVWAGKWLDEVHSVYFQQVGGLTSSAGDSWGGTLWSGRPASYIKVDSVPWH